MEINIRSKEDIVRTYTERYNQAYRAGASQQDIDDFISFMEVHIHDDFTFYNDTTPASGISSQGMDRQEFIDLTRNRAPATTIEFSTSINYLVESDDKVIVYQTQIGRSTRAFRHWSGVDVEEGMSVEMNGFVAFHFKDTQIIGMDRARDTIQELRAFNLIETLLKEDDKEKLTEYLRKVMEGGMLGSKED